MLTLKEKQLRILKKYNKSVFNNKSNDFFTAEEILKNKEAFKYDDEYNYLWNYYEAQKALKYGKIIIYSAYEDLKQGTLVSPQKSLTNTNYIPYAYTIPLDKLIWSDPYRAYIADIDKESDFDIEFSFLAKHKVDVWKECYYKIEAPNYEEAKKRLIEKIQTDKEYFNQRANEGYYYDYDTQEFLHPRENNNKATFIILESNNSGNEEKIFFSNQNIQEITAKKL